MNYKFSWVTDDKRLPNVFIKCQACDGIIIFNREEILERKSQNKNMSTPCRHCSWHPSYPPEPWLELSTSEREGLGIQ